MKAKKKTKAKKPQRGKYLMAGRGWRLLSKADKVFVGTLLHTFNMGKTRLAIFSVPK
jgi:hypothetical protein